MTDTPIRGRPRIWTDEQAAAVVGLVNTGTPYREIATRLDITLGTVQRILKARATGGKP